MPKRSESLVVAPLPRPEVQGFLRGFKGSFASGYKVSRVVEGFWRGSGFRV